MDEGGKGMEKTTLDLDNSYLSTVKEAFGFNINISQLPAEHPL